MPGNPHRFKAIKRAGMSNRRINKKDRIRWSIIKQIDVQRSTEAISNKIWSWSIISYIR